MQIDNLKTGIDVPEDIYVVVEIPANGPGLKLEIDKNSGAMLIDRFLTAPMHYPCNYGFIPKTLSKDGDPLDALIVAPVTLISGVVVRCRPIGLLVIEDNSIPDSKVLCVPVSKLTNVYNDVKEKDDLPQLLIQQIEHFFSHYKDLEPGKTMKLLGWKDTAEAKAAILRSVERFNNSK